MKPFHAFLAVLMAIPPTLAVAQNRVCYTDASGNVVCKPGRLAPVASRLRPSYARPAYRITPTSGGSYAGHGSAGQSAYASYRDATPEEERRHAAEVLKRPENRAFAAAEGLGWAADNPAAKQSCCGGQCTCPSCGHRFECCCDDIGDASAPAPIDARGKTIDLTAIAPPMVRLAVLRPGRTIRVADLVDTAPTYTLAMK